MTVDEQREPLRGTHAAAAGQPDASRRMLWVSLPDQRPRRELYWMSRMPGTHVTALAAREPFGDITWVPSSYRRPVKRFIEAGALAWVNGLDEQPPASYDWVTTLELCSLVTGQAARWRRGTRVRQAVITWENLPRQPLYRIPPYKQALDAARDADLYLCMIDAAREHLLDNGFDDHRIRVVKPGVDTSVFVPAAEPTDDPVVAFCSPLSPNKGIDRVLDAMRLVRKRVPEAELVVAGDGPLRGLVERAASDPRSGVHLAGQMDAHGVAHLLANSAVFCTAPRPTWKWTEQLGLAYLEAQACGIPVVTTRCGTNDEAVQPPNALVEDDVEALAAALVTQLADRDLRVHIGTANRERMVAEHDLATQCARMAGAFADIETHGR